MPRRKKTPTAPESASGEAVTSISKGFEAYFEECEVGMTRLLHKLKIRHSSGRTGAGSAKAGRKCRHSRESG